MNLDPHRAFRQLERKLAMANQVVPKYTNVHGPTHASDPERLIFYGMCGYWTDEWDTLKTPGGIPVCPECVSPGYQITADKWFSSATTFQDGGEEPDKEPHPKYVKFIELHKNRCLQGAVLDKYRKWIETTQ